MHVKFVTCMGLCMQAYVKLSKLVTSEDSDHSCFECLRMGCCCRTETLYSCYYLSVSMRNKYSNWVLLIICMSNIFGENLGFLVELFKYKLIAVCPVDLKSFPEVYHTNLARLFVTTVFSLN